MFEGVISFFKKIFSNSQDELSAKTVAKERLHLVLMQDRANVSSEYLTMMKQEIIEVIKKYIEVDENAIDVRLTNKENEDGTTGAPSLYANIPILNVKDEAKELSKIKPEINKEEQKIVDSVKNGKLKEVKSEQKIENKKEEKSEEKSEDKKIDTVKEDVKTETKDKEKSEKTNTKEPEVAAEKKETSNVSAEKKENLKSEVL